MWMVRTHFNPTNCMSHLVEPELHPSFDASSSNQGSHLGFEICVGCWLMIIEDDFFLRNLVC
jgi:hypothetical protein